MDSNNFDSILPPELFLAMIDSVEDCFYVADLDAEVRMIYVNQAAERHFGCSKEKIYAWKVSDWDKNILEEQIPSLVEQIKQAGSFAIESVHRKFDGTEIPVDVTINHLVHESGRNLAYGWFRDISCRIKMERSNELAQREIDFANKRLAEVNRELVFQKNALDQHAIVSITDVRGDITYINQKFCEISGFSLEELLGQNHRMLKSEEHSVEFYRELWRTIASGKTWHGELKNQRKDGSFYWVDATIVPYLNMQGKPFKYVSIRTDITRRKMVQDELHQLAMTDPLTGVASRHHFNRRFSEILTLARREKMSVALMILDLDHFKPVNDTHGHQMGDLVLKHVAQIFQKHIRQSDVVARLGGDEFAIILVHPESRKSVELCAQRILDEVSANLPIEGLKVRVGTSIGIAMFPEDAADETKLFSCADKALYAVKDSGRYAFRCFDCNSSVENEPE